MELRTFHQNNTNNSKFGTIPTENHTKSPLPASEYTIEIKSLFIVLKLAYFIDCLMHTVHFLLPFYSFLTSLIFFLPFLRSFCSINHLFSTVSFTLFISFLLFSISQKQNSLLLENESFSLSVLWIPQFMYPLNWFALKIQARATRKRLRYSIIIVDQQSFTLHLNLKWVPKWCLAWERTVLCGGGAIKVDYRRSVIHPPENGPLFVEQKHLLIFDCKTDRFSPSVCLYSICKFWPCCDYAVWVSVCVCICVKKIGFFPRLCCRVT